MIILSGIYKNLNYRYEQEVKGVSLIIVEIARQRYRYI